jgi:rubrerythrin
MLAISAEEDEHRAILSIRYQTLTESEFVFDPDLKPGPDFSFIEKSTFTHTDALDALSLCLGAEIDAINYYEGELHEATESADIKMLKNLVKFEKRHKKKLEREIDQLKKTNHWKL